LDVTTTTRNFLNMSAILKRFVPVASNASSVLRTRTAAVGVRMLSEGATARDPGRSLVPLLALFYNHNQLLLQKEGKGCRRSGWNMTSEPGSYLCEQINTHITVRLRLSRR